LPNAYNRFSLNPMHPFAYVMILTFLAAVATMLAGVIGMGTPPTKPTENRSTNLMALRVALCALLLGEILIYITYIK
jgi:hypothetical protein